MSLRNNIDEDYKKAIKNKKQDKRGERAAQSWCLDLLSRFPSHTPSSENERWARNRKQSSSPAKMVNSPLNGDLRKKRSKVACESLSQQQITSSSSSQAVCENRIMRILFLFVVAFARGHVVQKNTHTVLAKGK